MSDELKKKAEEKLDEELATELADRMKSIRHYKAKILELEEEVKQILDGTYVPEKKFRPVEGFFTGSRLLR